MTASAQPLTLWRGARLATMAGHPAHDPWGWIERGAWLCDTLGRLAWVGDEAALPAEAEALFQRLRTWRAATAKQEGVPAYVVFHDATLRQIAVERPATLAAVGSISGIGENKLRKYGQQVLDALAE